MAGHSSLAPKESTPVQDRRGPPPKIVFCADPSAFGYYQAEVAPLQEKSNASRPVWQIYFTKKETKGKNQVEASYPRSL